MISSVAIVGAGAIGSWLSDAFDRAGWRVSMVARGATLEALRSSGLRVAQGHEVRCSRPRAGSAHEIGVQDFVALAVKAQLLPELAPQLSPLIGPSTVVISATNGIPWWFFQSFGGPLENTTLDAVDRGGSQQRIFSKDRTLGAVVHASVRAVSPGHIEVVAADRLLLGAPGGGRPQHLQAVVQALQAGGIRTETSNDIRAEVWSKLWGNMTINPLSALTRSGTGKLLASTEMRELCIRMMEEMQLCAQRLNLSVSMSAAERLGVALRLGDFKTSMLADVEAGRPLELEPQLGAVVEIADRLDVSTPFLRWVLALARLISENQRLPG
ncbi:MAG TPA: 2-dehydropantoate 2-reductase [Steroidobacteraceae bacterium]|jgi:2-dehydropantoate 2-reductase